MNRLFKRYQGDEMSLPALLKRKAQTALRQWLDAPTPWVKQRIGAQDYWLRQFTIEDATPIDTPWIAACSRHARVMFDVGAHAGDTALLALQSDTLREVVLIEANPKALMVAAEHLIRNGLSAQARWVAAFAGATDGEAARLWTNGTYVQGSMYRTGKNAPTADNFIDVPTVTVDSLCARFETWPDFVKVDVEGAEIDVLQGSRALASRNETRFLVEIHAHAVLPMAKNFADVLAWCDEMGYGAWLLRTGQPIQQPDALKPDNDHLLLQPAAWPYPDWLPTA